MQSCVLLTEFSVFITLTESCAVVGYLSRQYGAILPSVSRKKTELFVQYNESFIDQSCSDKWLDIGLILFQNVYGFQPKYKSSYLHVYVHTLHELWQMRRVNTDFNWQEKPTIMGDWEIFVSWIPHSLPQLLSM